MLLGLEVLIGTYVVVRIFENAQKERKSEIKARKKKKRISYDQKISGDVIISEQEKKADRDLKVSTAALVLSATNNIFPPLKFFNIAVLGYSCTPIFKLTENSLRQGKIRNDLLNSLVILGCVSTGYYFTGALASWLFHFGSKMVAKIKDHSEKMLTNVFDQHSDKAWVLRDGVEIEVPLENISVGEIVVVNTGEVVPIDGTVATGTAMIDQHALTGEFIPAEKGPGDKVLASTLVVSGQIRVNVEKAGTDTAVSKISKILSSTADFKTGIQSRGEEWADKAAVPLLAAGGLSLPLIGIYSSAGVMNSSPGNAFRVWGSLLTLNHLTLASREGILVKDGRALEQLKKTDTVIFDKTGTLTDEQPEVGQILSFGGHEENEILTYAAIAERKVAHPLARAIISKAEEKGLNLPDTDDSEYKLGYGITVFLGNRIIRVGSMNFMETEEIALPDTIEEVMTHSHEKGCLLVMVALDAQLIGAVEIKPRVRPEVKKIISGLRQRGVRHIAILSGDHEHPTRQLSESLGMDSYFHNVLPEDKARIIEQLREEGKTVCFIGDGINDAIAMKKADVSISLSGATSVATDIAQVILMDGSLSYLCDLFDISKNLDSRLRQSLVIGVTCSVANLACIFLFNFGVMGSIVILNLLAFGCGIYHAMLPLRQIAKEEKKPILLK